MEWIFIDGSHVRAHQHSAGIANSKIGFGDLILRLRYFF
jgi:hypothetical protein